MIEYKQALLYFEQILFAISILLFALKAKGIRQISIADQINSTMIMGSLGVVYGVILLIMWQKHGLLVVFLIIALLSIIGTYKKSRISAIGLFSINILIAFFVAVPFAIISLVIIFQGILACFAYQREET